MQRFVRVFRYIVLLLLIFLIGVSYHPSIVSLSAEAGFASGTILSRDILTLFVFSFFISLSRDIFKSSFIRYYFIGLILTSIVGFIVLTFFGNGTMLNEIRSFVITFAALIIGWNISLSDKGLVSVILIFAATILIIGLIQIYQNIGGFIIEDQYLVDNKNSLGALVATASAALLFLLLQGSTIKLPAFVRFLSAIGFLVGILVLLTIRARAALLAVLSVSLYVYFLKHRQGHRLVLAILALSAVFLSVYLIIPDAFKEYVHQSIFSGSQGDDVSSGRIGTYSEAVEYIRQNPIWGNIAGRHKIGWIHNYPLLNIYQYGLLFSLPILYLYFHLLLSCVRKSYGQAINFHIVGFVLMLIPVVISLFEPTFPFGPGTVTVINFILLGYSLKQINLTGDRFYTTP